MKHLPLTDRLEQWLHVPKGKGWPDRALDDDLREAIEALRSSEAAQRDAALEECARICLTLPLTIEGPESFGERHTRLVTEAGCRGAFSDAILALKRRPVSQESK